MEFDEIAFLPSVEWNVINVAGSTANDIEEISLNFPITYHGRHEFLPNRGVEAFGLNNFHSFVSISPTFITDLSGEGAIFGGQFRYEPHFTLANFVKCGEWEELFGGIHYKFKIFGTTDGNEVYTESEFIGRPENETMLALGGGASFDLRPFGINSPLELNSEYQFLYDFSGSISGYQDHWEVGSTWWFGPQDNIGLSAEYVRGETQKQQDDAKEKGAARYGFLQESGGVWIRDEDSGEIALRLGSDGEISSARFLDEDAVIVSKYSPTVSVWNIMGKREIARAVHENLVTHITAIQKADRFSTATVDGEVWVWELPRDESIATLNQNEDTHKPLP